ncbi:hypothetical protein [Halobacterium jilantaiense]|uniref:PEP-CTERM protein-sorting domain-containing protein n=1 Tax=Halobacterium jilantaiense TaxID=355548 RepID=A0A1I0MU51_9EURY|nr:hypothetical protein [Halobacterium jilantaiense]SEV92347.1 hypothetical protein SAMN04487945_0380 [Halobacterium jilantaiense]
MAARDATLFGIALILAAGFFMVNDLIQRGNPTSLSVYGVLGGLVVSFLGAVAGLPEEPS